MLRWSLDGIALARLARRVASLLLCAAVAGAPAVSRAIARNHAEFTLRHDETIVENEPFDVYQDEGSTDYGPDPKMITGLIDAQYGTHELTVAAFSQPNPNGTVSLKAWSRHVFDVSGENARHHIWESFQSDVRASAAITTIVSVNAPVQFAVLRLFFSATGYDESDADINPPDGPIADLHSEVRLAVDDIFCSARGPSSVQAKVVGAKGRLKEDLEVKQIHLKADRVEIQVVCPTGAPSELSLGLEIRPYTFMINDGDERNLAMTGSHGAYFEQSAELIGVVVEDLDGNVLPGATIDSDEYVFPVLDAVPPLPEPEWTVLSPTAALGTDLGTYSAEVPLERTIDHSGITKPFTSGETDWDTYFDLEPEPFGDGHYANNWQSAVFLEPPVQGTIDFDFGGDYRIAELAFWNRTLENVRLLFALDADGPFEQAGSAVLESRYDSSYDYRPQRVLLDHEVDARYLRVAVDSAHLVFPPDTFTYAMLGEIAARATPTTVGLPEPAGSAVAALVALAAAARRARRARRGSAPTA